MNDAALGLHVFDELLNDCCAAALEKVPGLQRLFLRIDGADAAEFYAEILHFVDRAAGFFDQDAQDGRIGAEVVILERSVEHLLNGRLDAVFLCVARVDPKGPFREEAGAAEELELFKNDGLHAFAHGRIGGAKAGEAAAHDDEVGLFFLDGSQSGRCGSGGRDRSGRTEKLATIEFHEFSPLVGLRLLPAACRSNGRSDGRLRINPIEAFVRRSIVGGAEMACL